jgi:alkylation response protein AidB-like acyl-CoA dehydrogenase
MENVDSFRARARRWLAENLPRQEPGYVQHADRRFDLGRELQTAIYDAGFAGLTYPVEYGGQGLTWAHQRAFTEESVPYVVPQLIFSVTLGIIGPTILACGTQAQKLQWIPPMVRGQETWAQLLSEPAGGSDLAGVTTSAERLGDSYVVTGGKLWTTGGDFANFGLALVRTNWDVPKHDGLSVLAIPLDHPGVRIEHVRLATGETEFCQEFFDDVTVASADLVGDENRGWDVVREMLVHERNMGAGSGMDGYALRPSPPGTEEYQPYRELARIASNRGLGEDASVQQLIGEFRMLSMLPSITSERVGQAMREGVLPTAAASISKLATSSALFRQAEIGMDIGGLEAAAGDPETSKYALAWIGARKRCIAGGTDEIQRNIIAERVLDLPREHAPDQRTPFREVRRGS